MGSESVLKPDSETLAQLKALAKIGCTYEEAGAVFDVGKDAIRRFFERCPEAKEAWDIGFSNFKVSIRRKQSKLAESNAAMAIFLGKNYLNQRDIPVSGLDERNRPVAPTPSNDIHNLGNLSATELADLERILETAKRPAEPRGSPASPGRKVAS